MNKIQDQINSRLNNLCFKILFASILTLFYFIFAEQSFAMTGNLLLNPGAESGNANWAMYGRFTAVGPGHDGYYAHWGNNFWYGGDDNSYSDANQSVSVSDYASAIDDEAVYAILGGWFNSYGDGDQSELLMRFYNSGGTLLGERWSGRYSHNNWTEHSVEQLVPKNTRRITVWMISYRNHGSDNDGYLDDVYLYLKLPNLNVTSVSSGLNFGNLYLETNQTASDYNYKQTRTFSFKNDGDSGTKLKWWLTADKNWITFSETEGNLNQNSSKNITVRLDIPSSGTGNYNGNITINTTRGTAKISVNAVIYPTGPTVKCEAPTIGQNNKVNVPRNKSTKFKVNSSDPTFPGASISKYFWKKDPGSSGWDEMRVVTERPNISEKNYSFEDAGDYTVYCKWIDNNGVESEPLSIPIRSWNPPIVNDTPPVSAINAGEVSWYDGKFVGTKNKIVRLIADGTKGSSIPDESILKYIWDLDNNWDTIELEQPGIKGVIGEFYRFPSSVNPANINNIEAYIKDNNVATYLIKGFDTIDFPKTNGVFKHSNGYDTGLIDHFYARFTGFIDVPKAGNYIFHVESDDGFRLKIEGQTVMEQPECRSYAETTTSYDFKDKGLYQINLAFFEWEGDCGLKMSWTPPNSNKTIISSWSHSAGHVWSSPNPSGRIRCKAMTNYGVLSDEKMFDLKIYESLIVDADGPYTGRPNKPVDLVGSINKTSYPGAVFEYKWYVKSGESFTPVDINSEGKAKYTWTSEGDYVVKFDAKVTTAEAKGSTSEDVVYTGTSTSIVTISAGRPTAKPGGPYRGGIAGGNFSPVQFEGNPPDYIEAEDIGKIQDWVWVFDQIPLSPEDNEVYIILDENVNNVIDSLTKGTGKAEKLVGDPNSGREALKVGSTGDTQKLNANMPNWAFKIVQNPQALNEFRYLTFAWRKDGGKGIMLQLNGDPGGWDHKYYAGENVKNWTPAIRVSQILPTQWEIVTKDLYSDFGNFTLSGIAFSAMDGNSGCWDDVFLHKSPIPPVQIMHGWNAIHAYSKAGKYMVSLRVQSEFGKWSYVETTQANIIDGKITGYVRAADLRTPVKDTILTLTSSHVDKDVLGAIAVADARLNTISDGSIQTKTDEKGYYVFERIPLGSYRVIASKKEGETIHEFESNPKATEITLNAPNQLAIDFTDLSVFPISGRIVYSIQKNGADVLVENVIIEAQAVGNTNSIKSLPSNKSVDATGCNYNLPLFSGQYLFFASRDGHNIRIKETTPNYNSTNKLVTIDRARTDIDFIDYTTRELTVFINDSGGFKMPNKDVIISGDNGQAKGKSDQDDGKFVAVLPPGKYTVKVPGAKPETKEVDISGGNQAVTMTIPVKIILSISPKPKFFDASDEFLAQFGLKPEDNPEGYMYYYPPEPRTHTYKIKATANGNPVVDFNLFIKDEVSMLTDDPPTEEEMQALGEEGKYTIKAGKPKLDYTSVPPLAAPKKITFLATKEGYLDSDISEEFVTVLGDVPLGSAAKIVSIPIVNYTVLHDPPGDGSYSFFDDSMTIKGIVSGMKIKIKDEEIPVYPSPWRSEREIKNFSFQKDPNSSTKAADLEDKGLLGYKNSDPTLGHFTWSALVEAGAGALVVASGPVGYAIQLVKLAVTAGVLAGADIVQYEVSPNRHIETPSGDELPDLLGPGKGDVYYGEGWTLGLQTKYRLGIRFVNNKWKLETKQIETYDILNRTNQYLYTIRDIENIISDLTASINQAKNDDEKKRLTNARNTWQNLLNKNLAYDWYKNYVSQGKSFEDFKKDHSDLPESSETLIFSAGPTFEYSRRISAGSVVSFSTEVSVETLSKFSHELDVKSGVDIWGTGVVVNLKSGSEASIKTGVSFGSEWESGQVTEQSIGFVLNDDDVGDNISMRVYADPVWGTPLFFQDPGSYTSDPWEKGTNKTVDVTMELLSDASETFDYHEGAQFKVKVQYTGQRKLESSGINFMLSAPTVSNKDNMTVIFNGSSDNYVFELSKDTPMATIAVSLYPPKIDMGNSQEKQYEVDIQAYEEADGQISRALTLRPKFGDLQAPRALISSPYSGQRISPVLFPQASPFNIEVVSEDNDLASIQLQIRAKQPNGVWEPWRNLSGMLWESGKDNPNITVFNRVDRRPPRREFTFKWSENEIKALGVGEYAIRAVAKDKATKPNEDIDPPNVVFMVDDSKPSVLTTIPDYQARESQRIYRGELSVIFTDDMRADDFTDRTFAVTDLLKGGEKVAGFVSYSPALRKSIFVPIVPFRPNGFYRVEVKTDVKKADGSVDRGVHDLAGNPLDNTFIWTFRTTDAPFEETWSITLSVTDGMSSDANNIAALEYGASDAEDERDARAVPPLTSQMSISFLDRNKVEYDRDIRPADGRLSHHWFFVIDNAVNGSNVTIRWKPSIKLIRTERQYQVIRLVEFNADGIVKQTIPLDPTAVPVNPDTGEIGEAEAYTYKNEGERSRYFRLDVQKSGFVATKLQNGTSGWKFLSVPITPQRNDPFVNLGDDIDPLKLYQYDSAIKGYKIYPLDIGEVSLQTGRSYFTRLESETEVDVGGTSNLEDVTIKLVSAGWHAIGNPFILPVNVSNLKFNNQFFSSAVNSNLIEGKLYRWKITAGLPDAYEELTASAKLLPWEGYWIKTKQANITLTIPAPPNIAEAQSPLPDSYNPPMAPPIIENPQLSLRLELISDFASDVTTTFGAIEGAQIGIDSFDQSEPPMLSKTLSVYFDHNDWGEDSGPYNLDYQPVLNVGDERYWHFSVYTDRSDAKMRLSWEKSISDVPSDIMLYYRKSGSSEWHDMREEQFIDLISQSRITEISFDIRANRFEMLPPSNIRAEAGEEKVTIRWTHYSGEYVTGYTVIRQKGKVWSQGSGMVYNVSETEFVDTEVSEDTDYIYRVGVRFKTGTELLSDIISVRTMPLIKQTVLLQSYPNPFNPEVWIPYELSERANVTIHIYNVNGQLVRSIDIGSQERGRYVSREKAAYWDGRTSSGERASSGVYFYVLKAGKFYASRKMVLLK